jgi:hypothetical protein
MWLGVITFLRDRCIWSLLLTLLLVLLGTPAYAGTNECWWTTDDPSHPELSCTRLMPALLMSLEGASKAQVLESMGAPGSPDAGRVLRFESNYAFRRRGYSGAVAFTFTRDERVAVINAAVDAPHHRFGMKFVWNAEVPGCSDFPGSIQRCDNIEGAPRPVEDVPRRSDGQSRDWLPTWLRWPFFASR